MRRCTPARAADLSTEEFDVPRGAGALRVRRRRRAGLPDAPPVLMAHGSTYPSEPTFDLPVDGVSMMDALATAGVDVWTVDVAGYGSSFRPAGMDADPTLSDPLSRTGDAAGDFLAAAGLVLGTTGRKRTAMLGWSWGTAVAGTVATRAPELLDRLVQIAPLWLRDGPSDTDPGGPLGGYRVVDLARTGERWRKGLGAELGAELVPEASVDALRRALLGSDPSYSSRHPDRIRAPNGTIADTRAFWAAGVPLYDPSAIRRPVLVVGGGRDAEWPPTTAAAYYDRLTGAPWRQRLEVADGTHSLLLERDRTVVFDAVAAFITSPAGIPEFERRGSAHEASATSERSPGGSSAIG